MHRRRVDAESRHERAVRVSGVHARYEYRADLFVSMNLCAESLVGNTTPKRRSPLARACGVIHSLPFLDYDKIAH